MRLVEGQIEIELQVLHVYGRDHTGTALLYSSVAKGADCKGAFHCIRVPSIIFFW